jgi:hypothetical protein
LILHGIEISPVALLPAYLSGLVEDTTQRVIQTWKCAWSRRRPGISEWVLERRFGKMDVQGTLRILPQKSADLRLLVPESQG